MMGAKRRRRRSPPTVSSIRLSAACWWSWKIIRNCGPMKTFCACRTSWRARKTASRSSAAVTTKRSQEYNTYISLFPNNIVASFSGFTRNDAYFKTEEGARQAPKVNFGTPAQQPAPAPTQ